ncbi:hypothetical protein CERSUDRAFT_115210 [Gelatoporia subvermispora B]|uniref:F-box domain-containing protein n=1 Tax=Ceriporiopsis subvermispora (strain B) TaxID=914234 RepID=M2QGS8_CERS8|nr:hypothetical protein CERSUDRAFT_115210 [Gelatoporia subvermispora B]
MLASLPEEILLQIFCLIEVNDILAIRQTCRSLELFTRERSVWYDAFQVHVRQQGLSSPGLQGRPVLSLSATQLERLTRHCLRFHSNWISPTPKWTRRLDIHPDPSSEVWKTMNVSVQFLPGYHGRFVITNTVQKIIPGNHGTHQTWPQFLIQCWDLGREEPQCIARMQIVASWARVLVNSEPANPAVVALTQLPVTGRGTASLYTIDLAADDPFEAFKHLKEVPSFRFSVALHGDILIVTDEDHIIRLIDTQLGRVTCALHPPIVNDDPQIRPEEHRALQVVFLDSHLLVFCRQYIFIYTLPSDIPSLVETGLANQQEAVVIRPAASYKWQWRVDNIVVAPRYNHVGEDAIHIVPTNSSSRPPVIDILLRYDTWFPWPVNMLHQYALFPDPSYRPGASPDLSSDSSNVPYFASKESNPRMVHSMPSPVRIFSPSALVLGQRGTALWLEARPDPSVPEQAADLGQRVAGMVLSQPRRLPPVREVGGNRVMPGYVAEAPAIGTSERAVEREDARKKRISVFHETEADENTWLRVALEDNEGKVAVATANGSILLAEYAPCLGFS